MTQKKNLSSISVVIHKAHLQEAASPSRSVRSSWASLCNVQKEGKRRYQQQVPTARAPVRPRLNSGAEISSAFHLFASHRLAGEAARLLADTGKKTPNITWQQRSGSNRMPTNPRLTGYSPVNQMPARRWAAAERPHQNQRPKWGPFCKAGRDLLEQGLIREHWFTHLHTL